MEAGLEKMEDEAAHYRRIERDWQNETGYALLDKPYELPGSAAVYYRQFDRIIAELDPDDPGVVVEVGCGRGHLLRHIRERAQMPKHTLVGIDISRAVHSLPPEGLLAIQAGGEWLPVRDGCAACVIFDGSLHHCIDYRGALREAIRALRPGGSLVLFEPVKSRFSQLMHRLLDPIIFRTSVQYESPIDIHYKHAFSIDAIREELEAHGLSVRERRSDYLAYPFTGCYAGSPFTRNERFMQLLIRLEDRAERIPWLHRILSVLSWRFTIVATKPAA